MGSGHGRCQSGEQPRWLRAHRGHRFKEIFAPFLTLFGVNDAVLPRHIFGGKTGQVDAMWNLLETQIPEFQGLSEVRILNTPSADLEYLGLNLSDPKSQFHGPQQAAPPSGRPCRAQRAKQLLEEAGWKEGPGRVRVKDGVRMDLRIVTTTGDLIRLQTEQIIQRRLLEVGLFHARLLAGPAVDAAL